MVTTFKGLANKWVVLALLLASLGAALAITLLPLVAQDAAIKFPENSEDAVADFTAVDPEGRSLAKWAIAAADADFSAVEGIEDADNRDRALFSISTDGVLTFNDPPNYENSRAGATAAERNTYRLVLTATDGLQMTSYEKVVVEVTNEDEPATTGIEVSLVQPQEGEPVTVLFTDSVGNPFVTGDGMTNTPTPPATGSAASGIMDPDGDKDGDTDPVTAISANDVKWQWSRGANPNGPFTEIAESENGTRDQITYETTDADRDNYLRVVATYEDGHGNGKTLMATSRFRVAPLRVDTVAPSFPADFNTSTPDVDDPLTAKVADGAEAGTRVGAPVPSRSETARGERLTYSLKAVDGGTGEHADLFQIDRATGQVTVGLGKTINEADDDNANIPSNSRPAAGSSFTVTIEINDGAPAHSSGDASITHIVTTTMTISVDPEVDEAPEFTKGKMTYKYAEGKVVTADDIPSGASIGDPDLRVGPFAAYDPEDAAVTLTLSGPDAGKFNLPDAVANSDASVDTWDSTLSFKAAPDFEKPGDANEDNTYEVTVTASSGSGGNAKTSAMSVTVEVTNEDELGVVSLTARQPRIGVSISAAVDSDADGPVSGVAWQWQVATTSATSTDTDPCNLEGTTFTIGTYADAKGNGADTRTYTPNSDDDGKCLKATALYTDPQGSGNANAVAALTVQKARNLAPMFRDEDTVTDGLQIKPRYVDENAAAGAPVVINTDGETAAPFVSPGTAEDDPVDALDNVDADTTDDASITYKLSGADAQYFAISSEATSPGQITVKSANTLDYETRRSYMVTVTATDLEGLNSSVNVTINVDDVNEGPEIKRGRLAVSGPPLVPYSSMGTNEVGIYSAVGVDKANAAWSLDGPDAGDFSISRTGGVLTFNTPPDSANPADANLDNTYEVTVVATSGDSTANKKVFVMVGMATAPAARTDISDYPNQERLDLDGDGTVSDDDLRRAIIIWIMDNPEN